MLSFADPKPIVKYFNMYPDKKIFLDSGAFTAFTLGKQINIEELIAFIKKYDKHLRTYATLDVIGDYKATTKNTEYMESKGLHPLPVFHYKSPKEELIRLINTYDYFALGGLVPIAKDKQELRRWLDFCFSLIKNTRKVHGLGMTSDWVLKRYPFFTTDSTSYLQAARFGSSSYVNNQDLVLFNNKTKHYLVRTELEVIGTIQKEKLVTDLWARRGVVWDSDYVPHKL